MNLIRNLFTSSIGRKFIMAVSGLILAGFVVGHLIGNFQIFAAPDHINGYAHFLHSLGPLLWAVRIVLLLCAILHVWAGITLSLENKAARGAEKYEVNKWIQATFASRTMRLTGLLVLVFIVYHLAHFTLGFAQVENFKTHLPSVTLTQDVGELGIPMARAGTEVLDVYSMMFLGFAKPLVSIFYIIAVGLLSLHLWHGVDSLFQTFGWRNNRWSLGLRRFAGIFSLLYFLGNMAIPGAILSGIHPPAEGTTAHKVIVEHQSLDQIALAETLPFSSSR